MHLAAAICLYVHTFVCLSVQLILVAQHRTINYFGQRGVSFFLMSVLINIYDIDRWAHTNIKLRQSPFPPQPDHLLQAQVPILWLADGDYLMCYISGCRGRLLRCSNYFLYDDIGLLRMVVP